jgi:hypothetical protein
MVVKPVKPVMTGHERSKNGQKVAFYGILAKKFSPI